MFKPKTDLLGAEWDQAVSAPAFDFVRIYNPVVSERFGGINEESPCTLMVLPVLCGTQRCGLANTRAL